MPVQLRCKCGAVFKPERPSASGEVRCPTCRRGFRLSPEKLRAVFGEGDATSSERPWSPELDPPAWLPASPITADPVDPPPASPAVNPLAPLVDYSQESARRFRAKFDLLTDDEPLPPYRTFARDCRDAWAYPFWSVGNAFVFCILVAVTVLLHPRGLLGGFYLTLYFRVAVYILISGLLCGFYFSIVCSTIKNSNDLPELITPDWAHNAPRSLSSFLGSAAVAFLPAVLTSLLCRWAVLPSSWMGLMPLWIVLGAFLLPITLLLFALEAPATLYRPDQIVRTIGRTLLPYLAVWLVVLAFAVVQIMVDFPFAHGWLGLNARQPPWSWLGFGGLRVLAVYLAVVAMRVIGLYYLHYRRRFAIVLE